MNDIFTSLRISRTVKNSTQYAANQQIIIGDSINDIFYGNAHGRASKRIVIFGVAGSGKTTAVAKLAFDWTHKNIYSPLKDVPLLFVLKMHLVNKTMSLGDAIIDQLIGDIQRVTANAIETFIEHHHDDVVLIFDGYDDYSNSIATDKNHFSNSIIQTLNYRKFRATLAIVTSRPYLEHDFSKEQFGLIYDKIVLEGFSYKTAQQYIYKFFINDKEKKTKFLEFLEEEEVVKDLITTPLFNVLACYLWDEGVLKSNYTRTSFFDEAVNFLYEHASKKKNFLRLTGKSNNLTIKNVLANIGRVAVRKMTHDDTDRILIFRDADFEKTKFEKEYALKLGLLTNKTLPKKNRRKKEGVYVEFFHNLGFQYTASKYLSSNPSRISTTMSNVLREDRLPLVRMWIDLMRFLSGSSVESCSNLMRYLLGEVVGMDVIDRVISVNRTFDIILDLLGESSGCSEIVAGFLNRFYQCPTYGLSYINFNVIRGLKRLPAKVKSKVRKESLLVHR